MRQKPVLHILTNNSAKTWLTAYTAEHDLVIIGGGVGGYVAAIKAGQEGLKVCIYLFGVWNGHPVTLTRLDLR